MASKGLIQVRSKESIVLAIIIMTLLLIYILNIGYKYLNHISIDEKVITIRTVLGNQIVFDIDNDDVRIHFSTLSIRGSDKEGGIVISEGQKKSIALEGYYQNYEELKRALLTLVK